MPITGTSHPGTGDLAISIVRPGDITFSLKQSHVNSNVLSDYDAPGPIINNACIQSFDFNADFNRSLIECLGKYHGVSKEIETPINYNVDLNIIVTENSTGRFDYLYNCDKQYNLKVNFNKPDCPPSDNQSDILFRYEFRDISLREIQFNSSIGNNKTAKLSFVGQLGNSNGAGAFLFDSGAIDTGAESF